VDAQGQSVQSRATELASRLTGGSVGLAAYLGVSPKEVGEWICGTAAVPRPAFLKIVDIICDELSTAERHALTAARSVAQVAETPRAPRVR